MILAVRGWVNYDSYNSRVSKDTSGLRFANGDNCNMMRNICHDIKSAGELDSYWLNESDISVLPMFYGDLCGINIVNM